MWSNITITWPSGKLPFDCQKIAKNLTFFQKKKNCQKFSFFSKKLPLAIFLKKKMAFFFFWKNVKFLAIFWQSNVNFPEGQVETLSALNKGRTETVSLAPDWTHLGLFNIRFQNNLEGWWSFRKTVKSDLKKSQIYPI